MYQFQKKIVIMFYRNDPKYWNTLPDVLKLISLNLFMHLKTVDKSQTV